jgi:two-component system chemotaxis response regulator CheY
MNELKNKKIILSIDDDPIFRDIIKSDLNKMGFEHEFYVASDGRFGLKMAIELAKKKNGLDLIICDWNMPSVSGVELFQLMKQSNDLKSVPFLMITTVNTKVEILKAMKLGIKDYIVKPWSYEDFEAKVNKIFKNSTIPKEST